VLQLIDHVGWPQQGLGIEGQLLDQGLLEVLHQRGRHDPKGGGSGTQHDHVGQVLGARCLAIVARLAELAL
jgi:hypothetical protein